MSDYFKLSQKVLNVFEASLSENVCSKTLVQLTTTKQSASGEKTYFTDLTAVFEVFGNPQYKDCYAAIYTIAGPTRSGKSFLFSLLWKFLKSSKEEKTSEMWSYNNEKVKKLFQWRKGPKPCTDGIYILKEPIIIPFEKGKIALFLMDTQGIFDHNTSERNQTFLGTFSFLLSSFMFFNVDKGIKTPHLDSIYKFATSLRGSDGSFMMQKDSLMFIVRDWMNVETDDDDDDSDDDEQSFPYGLEGGKAYFKALIRDDSPSKAKEQKMMREYLDHAFGKDIPCCLLPHPGDAVGRKSCSVADLSGDFRRESFEFFQEITCRQRIKIKRSQNKDYKCGELCKAIEGYVSRFGHNLGVVDCSSFFEKDFRVKMSRHVKNRVEEFLDLSQSQDAWKGSFETIETIVIYLEDLKNQMKAKFRQEVETFYSQGALNEWEKELDRVLSQIIRNLKTCIFTEKAYKTAVVKFREWQKSNANTHLKEGNNFAIQAVETRNSLLQDMKQSIAKDVDEQEALDNVFPQCEEYFIKHTNKLIADIDEDIEEFLKKMKIVRVVVPLALFGVGAALTAIGFVAAPVIGTGLAIGYGVARALQVSGAATSAASRPLTIVGERITEAVFTRRIRNKTATQNLAEYSQGLQQYDDGEMKVALSFGILKFKLKVREEELF